MFVGSFCAYAQEFKSTDFRALDPVLSSGSFATSTSFRLFGSISEIAVGTSTESAFSGISGFLGFPYVSSPVVSATAGDGQVALSWTASSGVLGWTVTTYDVGQGTVSGGPYSYTAVGNVTSSTRTGLSNGTAYYFVVRPRDAFGYPIATSSAVTSTPVASSGGGPSGGGGGGGGGGGPIPTATTVIFSGRAYPKSTVTLMKDAQIVATTVAGADANFQISLSGISGGNYLFSLYSEDNKGIRSSLLTFPLSVTNGATTNVSGIFIAPTIAVDKSEVKRGDTIIIFGQSSPSTEITITINSEQEFFVKKPSDKDGVYLVNFDTSVLELGGHSTKSKASINGEISPYSSAANFSVGTKSVTAKPQTCVSRGDLNNDCRVNLVDFSIAAFWYKRPLSEVFAQKEKKQLNGDGKVTLVDFSIMAFYWTG